ncbi:glycosyl transferase family 2 [Nitratidesulfovibrio sp. HK-II]|uniref:glycosyl transferase family 2 n=1 Tax=Nitratidesulfovibrio sp. HK-II TaxID=2009266 RepID=UPI000E2E82AC|nr:glycosyl transferase family 2 [Nitratidesulfovibrio sp. HK-II]GBO95961.1 glycosyl transferase, group 2 family protein [Nitratidesulfovibrio sp. HK-II]
MPETTPLYSLITPSRGDRPIALGLAIDSVRLAAEQAGLPPGDVEMLVGFDGVKGERVRPDAFVRWYDFPRDNDFGNAIRNGLLRASRGRRIVFLDDDNSLTPEAFRIYEAHPDADMLIARIDVSRAHKDQYLPVAEEGRELVRQCNIDPLCLCLTRDLVVTRCDGWQGARYEADFRNIVRYHRRAHSVEVTDRLVGIYDSGRGLDAGGLNFRQMKKEQETPEP